MLVQASQPPVERAGVDLDEVILQFNKLAVERFNEKYGREATLTDIDAFDWYMTYYGLTGQQFAQDLRDLGIFTDADPFEGVQEALAKLMEKGTHVTIITSRGFLPDAHNVTERWLAKHRVPYHRLQVVGSGKTKAEYFDKPVDLFFDDHLKNHKDMIGAGMSRRNIVVETGYNHTRMPDAQGILHQIEYTPSLVSFINDLVRSNRLQPRPTELSFG